MKSRIKEHCITKIAKIKNILSAPSKDVLYRMTISYSSQIQLKCDWKNNENDSREIRYDRIRNNHIQSPQIPKKQCASNFFSFTLKPAESEFLDKKDIVARSLIYSPLYHHMRFSLGCTLKCRKGQTIAEIHTIILYSN